MIQNLQHVVITGSTRGIGRGMAFEFLKIGWMVTINGRKADVVAEAVGNLNRESDSNHCEGFSGDVSSREDMKKLWNFAAERQTVDIWINNAGLDQSRSNLWDIEEAECRRILDVNILGVLNCLAYVVPGMKEQGQGRIYNMEGFGSNGMTQPGISLYGSTKASISYMTKALKKELKSIPVLAGTISPGMVLTDLLIKGIPEDPGEAAKTKNIFNILADRVETVTPWIVNQIVRGSMKISWLTTAKSSWRFLSAPFFKRRIIN
jgi:NADP-dependent 3-hydroxy acid dehydrogenase YdfG